MIVHRIVTRRLGRKAAKAEAKKPARPRGQVVGLGDLVERYAKPIARWIDGLVLPSPAISRGGVVTRPQAPADPVLALAVGLVVRTGAVRLPLAGCGACSRRQRWLNRMVPNVRSWAAWRGALGRLSAWLRSALRQS